VRATALDADLSFARARVKTTVMAATPDEFVSWALGPERTIEEAFCAEILIDQGLVQWKSNNKIDDPDRYNFEVKRE